MRSECPSLEQRLEDQIDHGPAATEDQCDHYCFKKGTHRIKEEKILHPFRRGFALVLTGRLFAVHFLHD
mgnify:CR=1 FL=1